MLEELWIRATAASHDVLERPNRVSTIVCRLGDSSEHDSLPIG